MLRRKTLTVALAALLTAAGLMLSACTPQTPDGELVLDRQELEMKYGDTAVLTVRNKEPGELVWSSSNTDIAEVDQLGKVAAVGPGEAIITAQAEEKSVTCRVLVTLDILLTPDSIWIRPGETAQVQVNPLPKGASVSWSSADKRIADVDGSGNVTAAAPGKAEVTARVAGRTAVCLVNVYSEIVTKEQVTELIAARRPSEPQQSILEEPERLLEWLVSLEKWRTDLMILGNPGELYEIEAYAEIGVASTLYFLEPVLPVYFQSGEIKLYDAAFYVREEHVGFIENQAWLLLSCSKSMDIQVNEDTVVIKAELEDCIGEAEPGNFTIIYDILRIDDGTFRISEARVEQD